VPKVAKLYNNIFCTAKKKPRLVGLVLAGTPEEKLQERVEFVEN